jgi:drug/metabolite transporter (DMT)-like permease
VRDLGYVFPVWISRLVSLLALAVVALLQRKPIERPTGAWGWVIGIAVFDSGAFAAYNAGVAGALTSVVSVICSLYSAVTMLLAFVFLRERLSVFQWAAVGLVFLGIAMVSAGG